jgi:antitoxin component YwqK of YwqJK toxin-antitoxin module
MKVFLNFKIWSLLCVCVMALLSCKNEPASTEFETVTNTYDSGKPKNVQVYSAADSSKIGAKEFYDNGSVKVDMKYKEGKRNGPTYSYYKDGKPWSLNTFENDELHGPYQTWHENGQLYYDGKYEHNRKVGTWKFYNPSGDLLKTMDFDANPDSTMDHLNIPKL